MQTVELMAAGLVTAGAAAGGASAYVALPDRPFLPTGHAHNDYKHRRPLHTALRYGYGSVEADVFPVDGELLVAHGRFGCGVDRTLRRLYLDPLAARYRRRGFIHNGQTLQLLIDLKRDPQACLRILKAQLAGYHGMLSTVVDGEIRHGAVTVVLTGHRIPYKTAARVANVFCDGRLSTMDNHKPELTPLVSLPYKRSTARAAIDAVHATGRRVRFFGLPPWPFAHRAWCELIEGGADYISADQLRTYAAFCRTVTTAARAA